MDLKHKKVIVTGAARGIGRGILSKFINQGATVGVFDNDVEGLTRLREGDPTLFCAQCDITDHKEVTACVGRFYEEFQTIDVLVNNAGILHSEPLVGLTADGIKKHGIDTWNKVISTDLSSVFYVTVNVVEKMILSRTKGIIVNISSVSASGNAGQSAYSAAKAGVNALTATWAKELGNWGIRVAGIAPGFSDTESTRQALNETVLQDVVKRVPLRRLGTVQEIADATLWIIKNDFFHGKVLQVDGGLII